MEMNFVSICMGSYVSVEILNSIYQKLSDGVVDRKDDFHTMVFSNLQDNKVNSRSVIIRKFDCEKRNLIFHTDIRSPKVKAIRENPQTHCLFYHFPHKTQLRISTFSTVHYNDSYSDTAWEDTSLSSRKCYLTKLNPSQITDICQDGISENLQSRIPTHEESQSGKKNFAVVINQILKIDWLYLSSSGHQRALYDFTGKRIMKQWLVP